MAENLKRIQAPQLSEQYGKNIEDVFNNIDDNFGVVGNMDLYKGDKGSDVLVANVKWSKLLGNGPFTATIEDKTYTIQSQLIAIQNAFRTMINANENTDDVDAIISQLNESDSSVLIGIVPDYVAGDVIKASVSTSWPYVVLDERFRGDNIGGDNLSELGDLTDMSCVLRAVTNITGNTPTYSWNASRAFPYLYYNTEEGNLYWCINDTETKILAQGPKGPNGRDAKSWVVKATFGTENPYVPMKNITQVLIENNWVNVGDLPDDNKPQTGDTCIVLPVQPQSGQSTPGTIAYKYWISVIYVTENTYKTYCGEGDFLWSALNDQAFHDVMMNIGPENTNEGYLISTSLLSPSNKPSYYIISRDTSNNLHIGISGNENKGAADSHYNDPLTENQSYSQIVLDQSVAHSYFDYDSTNNVYTRGVNIASGISSHAEGYNTTASGDFSHAEGGGTYYEEGVSGQWVHVAGGSAEGLGCHAEGAEAVADGHFSHAEGGHTKTLDAYSHAEGYNTESHKWAHAEGCYTVAKGVGSHAEGEGDKSEPVYTISGVANTITYTTSSTHGLSVGSVVMYNDVYSKVTAIPSTTSFTVDHTLSNSDLSNVNIYVIQGIAYGDFSHAEGLNTVAIGDYSHAEGISTITRFKGEHACGKYNLSGYIYQNNSDTTKYAIGLNSNGGYADWTSIYESIYPVIYAHTLFSVGSGRHSSSRLNSFMTDGAGHAYIYNSSSGYLDDDASNPCIFTRLN